MKRFRHSSFSETQKQPASVLSKVPPGINSQSTEPGSLAASGGRPPAAAAPGHGRATSAPQPPRQNSTPTGGRPAAPALHDMGRIVTLFNPVPPAEKKFMCAGYLWKRVELQPDGKGPNPSHPDARWTKWYVQLTGAELSLWSVEKMEEAVKENRTVGPTFLKLTEAFVSAVDTQTIPHAGKPPPHCPWVFSLNNAASNRILFAPEEDRQTGQSTLDALKMWINCIRLAEWEMSMLNNIFTGTLLGLRGEAAQQSPLVKGRLEDWVQVRVPGDSDWYRAYLVVSDGQSPAKSKRRLSSFMSLSSSQSSGLSDHSNQGPSACFYASKRSKKPFLTYTSVKVAQAVFPEAEQLIPSTAVAKVEGLLEWDSSEHADIPEGLKLSEKEKSSKLASSKGEPHAVCLIMPDGEAAQADRQAAMLSWILAFADSFGLFGRKAPRYNIAWVPQNPESPYFAYPVGPTRDRLYFDVPLIVHMEPWQSEPSSIHKTFHDMLQKRMDPNARKTSGPNVLPQAPGEDRRLQQQQQQQKARSPLGARPSQGALQEESEPQEETLARPQHSPAAPQLAPLSGSGSMDMDNFFARAPVTPRMEDSPQLSTQARTSPPSTANTLKPSDRQAASERPVLPALQTSDSALHGTRAAMAPQTQRGEAGPMRDPRPVAMATGSNRFLEEKDLRRGPTPKMDARGSPQPGAQHSRGSSAAMSNQREDSLPLPFYPPEAGASAAAPEEPQKKRSSEPSSAYTLPSEYSQRSSPAPPLPEVQPLFKPQQEMSSAPGSLGLMYSGSPQQPTSSPVGPPDEPLPQPPPTQPSPGQPQETPFQTPPIGNGHVTATPEPQPEPSPGLALPGALPASSQHASIYGSSRAPSDRGIQAPEQQEPANATAGSVGALAHGQQARGPSSGDTAKADLPSTGPEEDPVQHLQRQASSSQGHSGIDDYASLALSYMNLAPAEPPQQQQEVPPASSSTRSQPSQAPSTAHTSTAAVERPRSTSPDPYGESGVSPTNTDMRMPEIKIGGGSKQSQQQQQGPQPSTFARSKGDDRAQASQRQKEGQGKAHHKPGRSVGSMLKSRSKLGGGAWDSDDEEDQEEEDDEEQDAREQAKVKQQQNPGRPPRMSMPPQQMTSQGPTHAQSPSLSPMREHPTQGGTSPGAQASQLGVAPGRHSMYGPQPERRSSRTLPVPPGQTQPVERSSSNQGLADHARPTPNPNATAGPATTQYRQPIPRSPSAMHRMQQLQQSEGGDTRPLSQYSTAGPMPQANNRPMSFMMQNYPEAAAEFQQPQQQPAQSYQGNTPSPPIATSRGGPLPPSGEPHKADLSGVAGFSTEGMLQAGLKSRHDQSAKQREALARESGAPLVDIGTSERQREMHGSSGMVGAMAERERAKSRDASGTTSALRKQHEQQQQHQQQQMPTPMQPYGHGHSPSQASGFFPPPQQQPQQQQSQFMNPMFNPYMMGMGGMGGMSPGGMNPFMLQQQAMMAAQQAYMNTMMSSSMGSTMSGTTSPQMGGGPSPSGSPAPGAHSPHMSMYGAPPGWGNPYMMNSMNMGGMGGFPGAPSPVPDWGSSHGHGNNGLNQSQRSMPNPNGPSPPLDESGAGRNASQ